MYILLIYLVLLVHQNVVTIFIKILVTVLWTHVNLAMVDVAFVQIIQPRVKLAMLLIGYLTVHVGIHAQQTISRTMLPGLAYFAIFGVWGWQWVCISLMQQTHKFMLTWCGLKIWILQLSLTLLFKPLVLIAISILSICLISLIRYSHQEDIVLLWNPKDISFFIMQQLNAKLWIFQELTIHLRMADHLILLIILYLKS